jgi:alpha-ketoglutarate-dependent taurine dioxygenase
VVDGEPVQVIQESEPRRLPITDLRELTPEAREAQVRELARAAAREPFDLVAGPLWRTNLLKLGEAEHVLLLTLHHIVADGWSLGVLFRELTALYNAYHQGEASPLLELPLQYPDYAVWQRQCLQGEVLIRQLDYWKERLRGAPALLALPTDHPRPPVQSRRGAHQPIILSRELTEQLRAFGRSERITLFMTLLAAFQVLLARLSKHTDIVVGTNVAGRNRPELESLIGFFINTLVIRTDLSGSPTFREVLNRVKDVYLDAHAHQDISFEKLLEVLKPKRSPSYSPLFQVKIDLIKNAKAALDFSGIQSRPLAFEDESSRYDMFLVLEESETNVRGVWNYNPDLFESTTIKRLTEEFMALLENFVKLPDTHLTIEGLTPPGGNGNHARKGLGPVSPARFTSLEPKPFKISTEHLVKMAPLTEMRLPLLIRPEIENLSLPAWAAKNADLIDQELRKHGAIIFRDFKVESLERFEQFIAATSGELVKYQDRSSPRSQLKGHLYSSTDHPSDQSIFLHNENSYSHSWPMRIFFLCVTPPAEGGETPIADARKISKRIPADIKQRFLDKGVMYVRNFGSGFGLPWQTVFQTSDKSQLESYCRSVGIELEWKGSNQLRTRQIRPAMVRHPETDELLWFNHAVFFHPSTLEPAIRRSLSNGMAEEELPHNTCYGDGSPIETATLDTLREIYETETVLFPWQQSDVLMLDNMLAAHGRRPFSGSRKIVVGMARPYQLK